MILIENNIMTEFEYFLKENNYEYDLEFQLCDLEMALNAGKELRWKPSEEQIKAVRLARSFVTDDFSDNPTLSELLIELEEQLKKLMEE